MNQNIFQKLFDLIIKIKNKFFVKKISNFEEIVINKKPLFTEEEIRNLENEDYLFQDFGGIEGKFSKASLTKSIDDYKKDYKTKDYPIITKYTYGNSL